MAAEHPHRPAVEIVRRADVVILSWQGVLFDRGRVVVHRALRETLSAWGVEVPDADLAATRGPSGIPQIKRLLSIPRHAEAFRLRHGHWATDEDLMAMVQSFAPRVVEGNALSPDPAEDAVALICSLRRLGVRTATMSCAPRMILEPQIERLGRLGDGAPEEIITMEQGCEPPPAPWGLFETMRRLELPTGSSVVMIDDSPLGTNAAKQAGATAISVAWDDPTPNPADYLVGDLRELLADDDA